ncbi:unnamed protein product [Paramecium primaurelia]|uniref:Wntless-like transmembrane domain-containing protein n=1 Tax=Paramecium primaurelia TaxID=5886 RepID=A0A8S1N0S1_PARPR|nr:unnamed protein product [Paramecium primaurelia]
MEVQENNIPNLQNVPMITGQPVQQENQLILIKVNADIETKKHVCIHWCLFFVLVTIFVLTSVFMPDSTKYAQMENPCYQNDEDPFGQGSWFEENKQLFCNKSGANYTIIRKLDEKNQFLIIYGQFSFYIPQGYQISYINYTATLFGLTKEQKETGNLTEHLIVSKNHSITSNCQKNFNELSDEDNEDNEEHEDHDQTNGNRLLQRDGNHNHNPPPPQNDYYDEQGNYDPQICDWNVLVYIPILDYKDYLFVINYQQFMIPNQTNQVKLSLQAITVDPRYSNSVLAVRYTFFAFSLITLVLFGFRIKQLTISNWVIEQKFVVVLSFLLPWFNDPLYAATLLAPNRITAVIGVIFFSNFICCLFLYWLVLYHRIVVENGIKVSASLTKPKVIVCILLWLFFVVSYSILVIQYFKDPTTSFDDLHHRAYMAFKVLSFLFSFAIFVYLLKYLIQFCKCYENRIWRYKLIGLFNIFFMMCLGLFILSGSFEIYNLTGTEVLISISILNLYVYYQQYLWSPSKQGLIEQTTHDQNIIVSNRDYEELEMDNININQENVVDEKFQVEDDKVMLPE